MSVLTEPIDALERVLGHSPHPAIVTLPLGALAVSNLADVAAAITGDERLDSTADFSMAVGLVGIAGAAVTGLRDYGRIPPGRQPNHRIATTHAIGNMIVGSLFATSYILRKARDRHEAPSAAARLLALAGGALSLYTGYLGGKLVSELGEGVNLVQGKGPSDQRPSPHAAGAGGVDTSRELGQVLGAVEADRGTARQQVVVGDQAAS